jgi:signal transduction histidine kinase
LLVLTLVGVAVVQAVGSIALYVGLSVAGTRAVDASARATSSQVADLVASGRLPGTLSLTGSEVVQVLDDQGRVLSASTNADRLTALLRPSEVSRALDSPVTVSGSRLGVGSRLRTLASSVRDPSGADRVVLVAEPVDELTRGDDFLQTLLLVSYPLLLAVLGLISWRLIGAALRPVEALRASAERISGSPQDERLPLPPARDELHALATTLNSMLDRVSHARDRERDLVADVAHELRSPLASLRMQVDVARRLGEAGEVLDDLDLEVTRMTTLVDDLLVLARLDDPSAASPGAVVDPVPVGPVLDRAARAVSRDGLTVAVSPTPLLVLARPDELERIVGNLVTNAARHATSSVRLSAQVSTVGKDGLVALVVLRVDDDGPGVPDAERERVFERFVRLDHARDRDSGGSGLGLAIARELARGLGGDVRLSASPAGGLRAEVTLPAPR